MGDRTAQEAQEAESLHRTSFVLAAVQGCAMIVNRLDYSHGTHGAGVGASLLERGHHESGEIDLLTDLAVECAKAHGPGVLLIDGGANIGTHAVKLGKRMTEFGVVLAFEAQERIFYALAGNIVLNNCSNVRAVHAALGATVGMMRIPHLDHTKPANFGGLSLKPEIAQEPGQPVLFDESSTVPVQVVAIDRLNLQRLDILKLDVEGMEPDVLDGAKETLERLKPIVFAETATCGNLALRTRLPDGYRFLQCGMNVLAVHLHHPLSDRLRLVANGGAIELSDTPSAAGPA